MFIDCSMGAAGDMLTGALLELMPDRDEALGMLNAMGIPGISFEASDSTKCGVKGTHVTVKYNGTEEVTEDAGEDFAAEAQDIEYAADHGHSHGHSTLEDIEKIIRGLRLPDSVKTDAAGVYRIIAEAEGVAHGEPAGEVHFHEVGSMDAVADAAAVCLLMHEIMPDAVIVSGIHVGVGYVRCAHGVLPVPAPATASILAGLPAYGGEIQGELCTPTGAALLKYFGTEFGADIEELTGDREDMRCGRGMGRKDFERPNCVTVYLDTE